MMPSVVSAWSESRLRDVAIVLAVLGACAAVAALVFFVNQGFAARPERAVLVVGSCLAVLVACPALVDAFRRRWRPDPGATAVLVLAGVLVALAGIYLYSAVERGRFPADLLIWSESDFVNDIAKLRLHYPLYTAQQNNESFTYMPGAQALTFAFAWLIGKPASVPVYRLIQLGFTLAAVCVSMWCARRLLVLSGDARASEHPLWTAAWIPLLLLVASNSITNPFVQDLHNDALTQLMTVVAYGALLAYAETRRPAWLAVMAVVPAAGFAVKQSLAIWLVFYGAYLAVFDRPRSIGRIAAFVMTSASALAAVIGISYLVWGDPFIYWVFTVLGSRSVSPLRAVDHALAVWAYLAAGLFGGAVLVRGTRRPALLGVWAVWLAMIGLETYTSGIAWMLNHIGPGSLVAGIWLAAALARVWPVPGGPFRATDDLYARWLKTSFAIGAGALACSGLGLVRIPISPLPADAGRYVAQIEGEFEGSDTSAVLLDMGSWMYLKDGVVMKDRAPSIGERGYSASGDFSALLDRLERKQYAKILVHNFHSRDFWYDHVLWRQSSGIRQALADHYREVRTIRGVTGWTGRDAAPYGLTDIAVLVPASTNTNAQVVMP